jgi:cytokinin dehydrogenase
MTDHLVAATGDFGGIVYRRPASTVRPASIEEVSAAVRFAADKGWRIGVQGQRHSTHGQAQVRDGLALSTDGLSDVAVEADARRVRVGAGVRWDALVTRTLLHGLIPPVLTDHLGLSVGGTLSVGGLGGTSFRAGTQTSHVRELTVVTGTGDVVTCSAERETDLFDAARCGLGQFGVVVDALVDLEPAAPRIRTYKALYVDLPTMLDDQRRLIRHPGIHAVQGFAMPNDLAQLGVRFGTAIPSLPPASDHPWVYQLKFAASGNHGPLGGLAAEETTWVVDDCTLWEFADRMRVDVALLRTLGLWYAPHPYLSIFLPGADAGLVCDLLATATPADLHEGPVILQVMPRRALEGARLRLPEADDVVLLSLLANAHPPTPARVRSLLAANRRHYDRALDAGGTLYPIGSVPMTAADWAQHHGERLPSLRAAKRRYDPRGIFGASGIIPEGT